MGADTRIISNTTNLNIQCQQIFPAMNPHRFLIASRLQGPAPADEK